MAICPSIGGMVQWAGWVRETGYQPVWRSSSFVAQLCRRRRPRCDAIRLSPIAPYAGWEGDMAL